MTRSAVATDDFNRASLDSNWAQLNAAANNISIYSSTEVRGDFDHALSNAPAARWVGAGTFEDDQYSSLVIETLNYLTGNYHVGVIARASADTGSGRDYYGVSVLMNSDTSWTTTLYKVVNGSYTSLYSSNLSWTVGDRIEIECEGTTIRALKNGTLINANYEVTDSDIASGAPGVSLAGDNSARGDDWEGGNLGAAPFAGAATGSGTASGDLTVTPEVVYDTATEHVRTDTTSPQTFSHAAASSGVRGVVVAIVHGTSATDHVSAVSYGGVALTRVVRTTDTATEPGAAELWFVGTGLSGVQGTQTVSYTPGSTTDDIHAVCMTVLSDDDLEVIDSDSTNVNAADPSLTLQYSGRTGLAFAALYGGGSAPSAFTPNANCTTVHDHDLGAFYSEVIRQTTPNNADFAIGGTAASDDVAFVAMAVGKVADTNKDLAGAATASAQAAGAIDAFTSAHPRLAGTTRRNRPGRGPYSLGRYYRRTWTAYREVASVAQELAGAATAEAQASAALAVAKALAGAGAVSGSADAALAVAKVLAGDASAAALADAGISIGKPLAGDAVASGLASGELLGGVTLEGAALAAAQAEGALTLAVPLAGAAAGAGTASADLAKVVTLSGAAVSSSSASGAIEVGINLAGAAIAGASADGELLLGVTLAGDALAGALASAGLTILGSVDLEGAATAGATASGSLSLTVLLTGAATAGATASAGLAGSASLAGDAQATGTASAELTLVIPIAGAAIASALASGSLTIVATLAGNALAGATASADLLKAVSLQGEAMASGQASAALGFREAIGRRTIHFRPGRSAARFARERYVAAMRYERRVVTIH